jgi:ketosteroid isomerase-like protein
MDQISGDETRALAFLGRMFAAELEFMRSETEDLAGLAEIFHTEIVVHEPASLPYAGDWDGHEALGRLLKRMRESWSSMDVENMRATTAGDVLFMCCTLVATARNSGERVRQPFAEVLKIRDGLVIEGTPYYYDTAAICAALEGSKK